MYISKPQLEPGLHGGPYFSKIERRTLKSENSEKHF
jgi:hypothetical protein